jgi:hypothetical protein
MSEKKFTKGTIVLHTQRLKAEFDALILGTLAIHRTLRVVYERPPEGGNWEEKAVPGDSWTLTHIATGMAVMRDIDKKRDAEALARGLEDIIPNEKELATAGHGWFTEQPWYPQASEVLKAWKAGL